MDNPNAQSASNTKLNVHSKLTMSQLSIMIFTLTCAGPFGIEEAIQSGGVLYTLIGLILLPLIYSIPQSLMCAELGAMMPSHHGYIIWVFRGLENDKFGHFFGFYNALSCIVNMALDIPIYIILMLFYFEKLVLNEFNFEFSLFHRYAVSVFLIFIGAVLNIANITTLGNSTIIFTVIILLPFFIGFIYSLPETDINTWFDTEAKNEEKQYEWGLWLSTMLWLHSGWDGVGCLSAEIGFKKSRLFYAFMIAIILAYIGYTVPLLGALTQNCEDDSVCWDDGYLYTAYNAMFQWLGWAVAISGFVSNFSLYVAEMSVQTRTFWAASQPFVILTKSGKMYIESHDGVFYNDDIEIVDMEDIGEIIVESNRKIMVGMLPKWLCGTIWNKTGAPVRGVILQSLLCCVLVTFDFEVLLEATVMINCFTWCLELASFLRLRYTEPDTERPYIVPGGMIFAWFITLIKFVLVLVLFILVINDEPYYILAALGFIAFTIVYYLLHRRYLRRKYARNDGNDVEREGGHGRMQHVYELRDVDDENVFVNDE